MKSLFKLLTAVSAGLLALSCVHQDNDLEPCETGIRLLFDWKLGAAPRSDTERLSVEYTGRSTDIITSPLAGTELDIAPGVYRFTAWEAARGITIDGTALTVASTDGAAVEPQEFSAGTVSDEILNTTDYQEIHVPMYRQTRDLIIRIRFTGDGVSLIRGATGVISGVALERDVIYGFPPVDGRLRPVAERDGTMAYSFVEGTDAWFTDRRTLLGIDGDQDQMLSVTVSFDDNYSTTETVEVTSEFNMFHTENVTEPWVISLTLEIGVTFDMVIVDWYSGAESWLDAE